MRRLLVSSFYVAFHRRAFPRNTNFFMWSWKASAPGNGHEFLRVLNFFDRKVVNGLLHLSSKRFAFMARSAGKLQVRLSTRSSPSKGGNFYSFESSSLKTRFSLNSLIRSPNSNISSFISVSLSCGTSGETSPWISSESKDQISPAWPKLSDSTLH